MIIVRNEKMIKRSTMIGRVTSIGAIAILAGGMYISIRRPEEVLYSLIALMLGFTLSQVGVYYTNRFGRSPRPDQALDAALKGLDDSYTIYHYQSPVPHLLIGPSGLWNLVPYALRGKIVYNSDKGRWKNFGGGYFGKLFGQDTIGNPEKDRDRAVKHLNKEFNNIPDFEVPEIRTALVFTHEDAEVVADDAPVETLHGRQLKKLIRKEAKSGRAPSTASIKTLQDFLGLVSNV